MVHSLLSGHESGHKQVWTVMNINVWVPLHIYYYTQCIFCYTWAMILKEDPANLFPSNDCWLRCHGLQLYRKDESILSLTAWLNDNHINAAMRLMHAVSRNQWIPRHVKTIHEWLWSFSAPLYSNHFGMRQCTSSLNCENNGVKVDDSLCYPLSSVHHLNFREPACAYRQR